MKTNKNYCRVYAFLKLIYHRASYIRKFYFLTSFDPATWSPKNSCMGVQVFALLADDFVKSFPVFISIRDTFWNNLYQSYSFFSLIPTVTRDLQVKPYSGGGYYEFRQDWLVFPIFGRCSIGTSTEDTTRTKCMKTHTVNIRSLIYSTSYGSAEGGIGSPNLSFFT